MDFSKLNLALSAALKAGEAIMKVYEEDDFQIESKADNSPLTKADRLAHDIIASLLQPSNIPILSEEGKEIDFQTRSSWDTLWIVDPIDGTKEFIKKNGEFTVNIALVRSGKPIMGIVYAPAIDELYFADENIGAYFFSGSVEKTSVQELIPISKKLPDKLPEKTTVVASRSHLSPETKAFIQDLETRYGELNLISKGSSLKICMVAKGEAHYYPRFAPTMEWDTAAGHAIASGAGCKLIDWETQEEMKYNRDQLLNNWFLVSNVAG